MTGTDPRAVGGYLLLSRLGSGGMGVVYLARSAGGRLVALKVMDEELAAEPAFRQRFRQEVDATRVLAGAFAAPMVEADVSDTATMPWLATAYLPGISLQETVTRHGPLPAATVWMLAAGFAEALAAVHRAGIVHHDLTPSNVMLLTDGPRLIDFGLAALAGASSRTRTAEPLGSPAYVSPEQALGEKVGTASDMFSYGAVLAFAATGAGPFGDGPAHTQLYRVVNEEPSLAAVPDEHLRQFLAYCLAKDPAVRPTLQRVMQGMEPIVRQVAAAGGHWLPPAVLVEIADRTRTAENATLPARYRPYVSADDTAFGRLISRRTLFRGALGLAGVAACIGGCSTFVAVKHSVRYPWSFDEEGAHLVVAGNLAFVFTAPDNLYALDAQTGRQLWTAKTREYPDRPDIVVANGNVYVFTGNETNVFNATTGRSAWANSDAWYGPATVSGDTLYYQGPLPDNSLTAVDARTGVERWHGLALSGLIPPLVCGQIVGVVDDGTMAIHGIDARTGKQVWSYQTGSSSSLDAKFLAGRDHFYYGNQGRFLAIGAASGKVSWQTTGPVAAPVLVGNTFYLGAQGGTLHAYDATSGKLRWAFPVGAEDDQFGAGTQPTEADGMVYFHGSKDKAFGLVAASGKKVWELDVSNPNVPNGAPAVLNGVVYVIQDENYVKQLAAVDARTGKVLDTRELSDFGELTIAGRELIYVQTGAGIVALRAVR
ncbi:serine/threonine-protein kinase [Fodinicola feengrottensis]|uniref:serine/threonine-protein kinase n=1 Tax=Fodinicola feengrottensis TaxID=435914 RepID=UPI0031CE1D07